MAVANGLRLPCPFCGTDGSKMMVDVHKSLSFRKDELHEGTIRCPGCGFTFHITSNRNKENTLRLLVGKWNFRCNTTVIKDDINEVANRVEALCKDMELYVETSGNETESLKASMAKQFVEQAVLPLMQACSVMNSKPKGVKEDG